MTQNISFTQNMLTIITLLKIKFTKMCGSTGFTYTTPPSSPPKNRNIKFTNMYSVRIGWSLTSNVTLHQLPSLRKRSKQNQVYQHVRRHDGKSKKFRERWRGPFLITKRYTDLNYQIRIKPGKLATVNIKRLKKCHNHPRKKK
jgi:hypothetical protein